jgi:acetylornithine deacetylase/succinyl-diaminopimelate desuccinylase family protein
VRTFVAAEELVELTRALVSVDTRNPPGNERPIEEVVRDALSGRPARWSSLEPRPGRLSLVAELEHPEGPRPGRPVLIVNGHLDVVPVDAGAWSRDPFDPVVVDGRIYGRGSADMKGGLAAAIRALDTLTAAGIAPACDVVFHFVADEERGGQFGTQALLDAGFIHGDACLVPEPTGLELCIAERGLLHGYVHVTGRAGHGSRPRDAVSAIEHAARLVVALHAADFGDADHPLLGTPTANIGTIRGGTTINSVAESCTFGIDRRILPGATVESTEAGIREMIERTGIDGLVYSLEVDNFGEASELPAAHPWVGIVGDAVLKAIGRRPGKIGMTFTTDARFVRNQAGIPAVVCGPGEVAQAHTVDEWVSVEQLVDACAAYAELFGSFEKTDW